MGRPVASWSTPLVFQSKLLCLSLLYLVTTIFLSLHVSFSQTGCIFRLPATLPPPSSGHRLFSYPASYGEHKHAVPALRSSAAACASPVLFPDYRVAFEKIQRLCRNSPHSSSPVLRYMEGRRESFGGNFSTQKRKSYFDRGVVGGDGAEEKDGWGKEEVPCGFFWEFPVRKSDRLAMEKCKGVVVASAIFGDHDKIRQPRGLGLKTLETVCFFMFIDDSTLRALNNHDILLPSSDHHKEEDDDSTAAAAKIGVWRVVRLSSKRLPYEDPAMNGVIPKHLVHRLFPNSKFSVWVDAKIQLTADPLLLIHSLLVSDGGADMALSKHPFNVHTMEEAMATARWKKWGDVESLRVQMEAYCENGLQPWSPSKLPYTTDVPDTALILRRHGPGSDLFSCLLFNELEAFNPRDQLAFAYVRDLMRPKIKIRMFEVDVFEQIAIEYRHNLKPLTWDTTPLDGGGGDHHHHRDQQGSAPKKEKTTTSYKRGSSRGIGGSSCESYLLKMWREEESE